MQTVSDDPLFDALAAVGRAYQGLSDTLRSVEECTPPKDAPTAEQLKFRDALADVLDQAVLSLAMATGEVAFHTRRVATAELVAASAARTN